MSDKPWKKLNELDQKLRRAFPSGMIDRPRVTITMFTGFEIFNTRPYHNYENWGTGYRAEIHEEEFPDEDKNARTVSKEDLDDLVDALAKRVEALKQNRVCADCKKQIRRKGLDWAKPETYCQCAKVET